MKMKSLLLLLAFAGLGAGCTSDDPVDVNLPGTRSGELQLVFSGANGESQEYTKAIASESENKIDKLNVYLFAAAAVDGPYYYLETWEEGTAYDPTQPNVTKFVKQGSGTSWKASIYPNELHGLPYLRLYCVANNGSVGNITDGKFYNEAGTEVLSPLTAITADAANAAAATSETAFLAAFTQQLQNTDDVKDIIHTPLLMTGHGSTKISGSVSKVNIDMKRVVARFDIDNTSAKSQLTIEKISMAQARKSGSLWNTTLTPYENDGDRTTNLMTYAEVDYTIFTGANQGTVESALYVYPGLAKDESYLVIEGKYKSPLPGAGSVPVTYHVPIVKTDPETNTSNYVAILANNRYQLHITDVTQSNIYATFEVEDWTSGGGIQIKPDNDTPLIDATKNDKTGIIAGTGTAPVALGKSKTDFRVTDGTDFKITVAATGKVRYDMEAAFTKSTSEWLTLGAAEYEEIDGIQYTTFTAEVNNAPDKEPVAVHFINETASYDPDLWTTLTFYGPSTAPTIAEGGMHSLGNTIDAATNTAGMYNVVGGYLTVNIWCVDGSTLELPAGDNFALVGDPIVNGFQTSYKVKIVKALMDNSNYSFKFNNNTDPTLETTLAVNALPITMTADLDANATDIATITGADDAYTVTTDITKLGTNTYTLNIHAPQNVKVSLPNGKWLKIVEDKFDNGIATFTVSLNSATVDYSDFNIVFVNKLDETDKLTVTMNKGTITTP
ncbi:MAG: hypothetical protein LUD46_16470 [Parabacteroides sp.]|nr:hypothetical protein [Parabacteroides sp.]